MIEDNHVNGCRGRDRRRSDSDSFRLPPPSCPSRSGPAQRSAIPHARRPPRRWPESQAPRAADGNHRRFDCCRAVLDVQQRAGAPKRRTMSAGSKYRRSGSNRCRARTRRPDPGAPATAQMEKRPGRAENSTSGYVRKKIRHARDSNGVRLIQRIARAPNLGRRAVRFRGQVARDHAPARQRVQRVEHLVFLVAERQGHVRAGNAKAQFAKKLTRRFHRRPLETGRFIPGRNRWPQPTTPGKSPVRASRRV